MNKEKCEFLTSDLRCDCVNVFMYEKYKYMGEKQPKCDNVKDCYFKQLQIAREKNEKLKEQWDMCGLQRK